MSRFPGRPTLADVAAEAGVSAVTVSRVIEGSSKVASRTQSKVHAAMDALGYFGNAAASHLVSGQVRTIGVVTANTSDYGYAAIIQGIESRAREKDMAVLIAVAESGDDESVRKVVRTVASHALAGVIVVDFDSAAHAALERMPAYLPTIATTVPIREEATERPYVAIDEYIAAGLAAEHLIELGHRSIFVLESPNNMGVNRRTLGVQDALAEARLPHYPVIACRDWQPESGYRATTRLVDEYGDNVTAIVCGNDEIAVGAMRALGERGLRVPDDVSVIGFDDNPIAEYVSPALTTVKQDFREQGRRAFDVIFSLVTGEECAHATTLDPQLVVRESTAAPNPARGISSR